MSAPENLTDIIALGVGEYLQDERFNAALSDGIHEATYADATHIIRRIREAVFTFAEYAAGGRSGLPTTPSADDIRDMREAQLPQWRRHFVEGLETIGLKPNGSIEEY